MNYTQEAWFEAITMSVSIGFLVAFLTALVLPTQFAHLPGGSLFAGCMAGFYTSRSHRLRPVPLVLVACGVAGVLGWVAMRSA